MFWGMGKVRVLVNKRRRGYRTLKRKISGCVRARGLPLTFTRPLPAYNPFLKQETISSTFSSYELMEIVKVGSLTLQ